VFSVQQRDEVRDRILALARSDPRIVAGAVVGSLALGGGDRFSDLDLTFGVSAGAGVIGVLDDWTVTLRNELNALPLVDLGRDATTYRVFLLPDLLQVDLSMTPVTAFRPAGPGFRLLFGETAPAEAGEAAGAAGRSAAPTATPAADLFGWGVVYALHARACIERGRMWQAEHYVGAVRDHALSISCLRQGLVAVQARGYDDLPSQTLANFENTHVGAINAGALGAALSASVRALMGEGSEAGLANAPLIAARLAEMA
jgi:hypothetical protein